MRKPSLWIVLASTFLSLHISVYSQPYTQKRVLILYGLREGSPLALLSEKAMQNIKLEGRIAPTDFYREYIDVARFPDPEYRAALSDFLKRKYEHQKFDLIFTVAVSALDFMEQYGEKLFRGVPVVFIGGGSSRIEDLQSKLKCTGVYETVNLKGTLELALKLQPSITKVFVVSGASEFDQIYEQKLRDQSRELDKRLTLTYMNNLSMEEIQKAVANLSRDSIIYYLIFTKDRAGNKYSAQESLQRVTSSANVPVYIWFAGHLEPEVIGGSILDFEAMANEALELAVRILKGEKAEDIPIVRSDWSANVVNWPQLVRWGISETRVPAGSQVRSKEATFWERYKNRIIAVLALVVLQTLLIGFLLIERDRRKRANAALDERLRFETLLSELSAEFASLPGSEVDPAISKWVKRLGDFLGVDQSSFVEVTKVETTESMAAHQPPDVQLEPVMEKLRNGLTVNLHRVTDQRLVRLADGDEARPGSTLKSLLAIPISVNDSSHVLTFASLESYRDWPEDLVRRLRLPGEIFADAIVRKDAERALQQLTARLLQLQDEERRRIARELHDVTAQNLGTITINLEGLLQNRFRASDVLRILSESRALGEQSLKELRTLSYVLHPPMLEQAGLVFALEWFIDGFIKRSGIHVGLVAPPDLVRLAPEVEIALFRIVQECLINIHRHSGSTTAEIRLETRNDKVVLEVKDHGRGIRGNVSVTDSDDVVSVGVGIPGMKQRLSQLGGSLEIKTSDSGTTITAIVPVGDGEANGSHSAGR